MSAQDRPHPTVATRNGTQLGADEAGFFELSLVRSVDNVRMALLFLILVVALASPHGITSRLAVYTGLIIGVFLTLWTRYAARWNHIHEAGRMDVGALVILLGDIAWLGLFVLGTGGIASPFVALLIVPIIFASAVMGMNRSAVPLATGIIILLLVAFTVGRPLDNGHVWRLTGLSFAFIAVGWVVLGQTSVLERERRTNELIVRFMDEAVLLIDRAGVIRLVNPQVERFVGLPVGEIVGLNINRLPNDPRYEALRRIVSASPEDQRPHDVDVDAREHLELRVTTVRVDDALRRRIAHLIICQDITDLKLLARAHASGARFLSHEIRSPLTTLKTIASVFGELAGQLTDEGAGRLVDILDREVDRMLRLARQFLDLAALEEGGAQLSIEPVNVCEIVDRVAESLRIRAEGEGLNFSATCADDVPTINADAARLEDVLHNLGDNAVKYTEAGGSITLSAACTDGEVRIAVSDTGRGIPAEFQERVFQQFVRGPEHAEGPATDGLGLGLFMTRQIVTMLGGRIELESEEGRGSTFSICLPVDTEA